MSGIVLGLVMGVITAGGAAQAGGRPVVAVLAQNDGTEITDFMVPYGVIGSAGVADVVAVADGAGPIDFMNGLEALPDATLADFDASHPDGAQFVIIPAFHDPENDVTREWLRAQSAKGAVLVSICDGAMVLAGTGLLDGREATGHFYSLDMRRNDFADVKWQTNTRFVKDGNFVTSSGISASLPAALYVVELIAGREAALAAARSQGMTDYSAAHDSDRFHLGWRNYLRAAWAYLTTWPRDDYALEVGEGVDEVGFAFAADMLPRTYRAHVDIVADTPEVKTRNGLRLLRTANEADKRAAVVTFGHEGGALNVNTGAQAFEDVAAYLTTRYGAGMAGFVTTQMEYAAE
tara:strand:+ start:400 stop:1446 length:1047 start_codon:yes stop_codon:yes gene_type:complete